MDILFIEWLTLVSVFTLAVVSPGPDLVMVIRNSITYSKKAGIFTSVGLGISILMHASYTILGIAAIISSSILLFNIIKYLGAAYLLYIGVQALLSKSKLGDVIDDSEIKTMEEKSCLKKEMSPKKAILCGFLTNALNPKATLFFLAIFTQIIDPQTPVTWQVIFAITCSFIIIAWFSFVAVFLNQKKVRLMFSKFSKWIDKFCGAFLVLLGIKVATSS